MSAISTLRNPKSAARRISSSCATTCSMPHAAGASEPPAGARAEADAPHAGVRPREQADLDAVLAPSAANSASSCA